MADKDVDEAIERVLSECFGITKVKPEQRRILNELLKGRDCMAVLPTGFGKSLPYQMLIPLKREMGVYDGKKVIVCSPLLALMQDQCEKLNRLPGVKAIYTGDSSASADLESGSFDYMFASPEALVGNQSLRSSLQQLPVSTIVVDEFHTIATWGEDEDGDKKAFRKWFSYIGELRSVLPDASDLALSATCTKKISRRVKKVLNLDSNTSEIRISPNRENIKIVVQKISNTLEMALAWIVESLQEGRFPKTVIYCQSIKDASKIYMYIMSEIPDCNCIEMYHSETEDKNKANIMEALKDPNSELKIVVATSALSLGIDIVNFYCVILIGCPKSVVDLIQEIGRVGHDDKTATALLLYNSYHLRNIESEVKVVYTNSTSSDCRRVTMLTPFIEASELQDLKKKGQVHSFCDLCNSSCTCGSCSKTQIEALLNFCGDETEDEPSDDDTELYDLSDYDLEEIDEMSSLLDQHSME